jgi:hypothetical protein
MSYKTITGSRPEVVTAVKDRIFAPLTGMIGARLFPIVAKRDKAGTLYFKTLDADSDAAIRATTATDYDRVTIGSASQAFSCTEYSKAYLIPEDQAKDLGGIEAADRVGIAAACRSVVRAHENAVAGKFFTSEIYNDATYAGDDDILIKIQEAAYSIGRYYGKTVLAASHIWFQRFALATAVQNRLIAIIGNAFSADAYAAAVAGNAPMAVNMLKAIMPIDEFLIGEDAYWAPEGKEDMAIIAKAVPSEIANSAEMFDEVMREQPVLGVTPWFLPDADATDVMFEARSFFDEANDCNVYKAKGWLDVKKLNDGFRAIKFTPSVISTTSTTTSTTTTSTTSSET